MAVRRRWVKETVMPEVRREFDPRDPLDEALDAVRRDDATTEIPARIEHQVMLAWDAGTGGTSHRRRRPGPIWFGAIAASVLCAAIAFSRYQAGRATPFDQPSPVESARAQSVFPGELLFTEVALNEDAASLQYVQLRVTPSAVRRLGFPLPDLADDQPVDVEALVGLDGVPRALRPTTLIREHP
jgi:hypothetical protein